jgi:ubiquinone/menaquinone biosynthesis C-methylase UbiE
MIQQNSQTQNFWNSDEIIKYFSLKDPDPRVIKYLKSCSVGSENSSFKVLDVGCGGGRHIFMAKSLGYDIYGIDINQGMVDSSIDLYTKTGGENADQHIKLGELLDIPFENETFDFVICTGVLHQARNFVEYKKGISEIARVLKKGSGLAINVFTNKVMDETYKIIGDEGLVETKERLFMSLLTKEKIYEFMSEAGLNLVEELSEDEKMENTGVRVVLRSNFKKV